jgi:antitoxin FitA
VATLTIKNVPDVLVRRLKAQAQAHRRSLNAEVIHALDRDERAAVVDVDALIAKARAVRRGASPKVSMRQLNAWKRSGRL